jgi:hypothetical protein
MLCEFGVVQYPTGLLSPFEAERERLSTAPWNGPVGVDGVFDSISQVSSFFGTAGLNGFMSLEQNKSCDQRRIVAELDALTLPVNECI